MDEKQRIVEILRRLVAGDKQWLSDQFILVGKKADYWVLNYLQGPRTEYNGLVRGMVVRQVPADFDGDCLSLIVSFPFTRFFNQGEKEAAQIDFSDAEMLEKLDGTLVGVFFRDGKPQFHTRKMVSSDSQDWNRTITSFVGKEFRFMPTIGGYVNKLKFSPEDFDYTYVFEFIHEASYVLTKYSPEQYGLYLLGARHLPTHRELTEEELDITAVRVGVRRPRRWDAVSSMEEIEAMMKEIGSTLTDFEGFVFRDRKTGNRLKVKDAEYVRRHHMIDKGRSFATLLSAILHGEEEEILAYLPYLQDRIVEVKSKYVEYLDKAVVTIRRWQEKDYKTRKDLAIPLFGQMEKPPNPGEKDVFVRNQILKNYAVKDGLRDNVDNAMKEVALGCKNRAGQPKDLALMIGLNDEAEPYIEA